jgi:hypothetical protein
LYQPTTADPTGEGSAVQALRRSLSTAGAAVAAAVAGGAGGVWALLVAVASFVFLFFKSLFFGKQYTDAARADLQVGGRWEVGGGRWEVGGGRWQVGSGRWQVAGGR